MSLTRDNGRDTPPVLPASPDQIQEVRRSALALFSAALRKAPARTGFGLFLEYGMFAAAVFLALGLFLSRVPLAALDRITGLRLRERFIDLIARVSPG